jgi:hypothetical protein
VIEAEIVSVRTQKNISASAGTFDVVLMPTKNWKALISPGDWIIIYLYNNKKDFGDSSDFIRQVQVKAPNSNIIFLGNVDRISRTKQKDEATDKTIVRYRVGGRDFGKVFEQTDLWFDPYKAESQAAVLSSMLTTRGLPFSGDPTSLVSSITEVFLSPLGGTAHGGKKTLSLNQWMVPYDLLITFFKVPSVGRPFFYDMLKFDFFANSLPGYKDRSMISPKSNGSLWSMLKRNSNDVVNEMFVELRRDKEGAVEASLVLRPRPNSVFFKDAVGNLKGAYESLQKRAKKSGFTISPIDIIYEDLGKDDNTRANMVWLNSRQSAQTITNHYGNVAAIEHPTGIGLPMVQQESIDRYGLKRFEADLDFSYSTGTSQNTATVDAFLYRSFIDQLYDQRAYLHCYDTGTLETPGDVRAEIGKVIRIQSDQEDKPSRIYYIEGYQHNWRFPGIWTTDYTLTMGQFDDEQEPFIDLSSDDKGQIDDAADSVTLTQTIIDRGIGAGTSKEEVNLSISGLLSKFVG